MPAPRRKNLLASRRRRQDEGEEEGSILGDFEDDSLSEGSAVTNGEEEGEFEGSESSGDERDQVQATTTGATARGQSGRAAVISQDDSTKPKSVFAPSADTEAMLHGLSQAQQSQEMERLQFDNLPDSMDSGAVEAVEAFAAPPKASRQETIAQRARREHQEYVRQRNANPAFVPTRGGFFLHDDRNSSSIGLNTRPLGRGRGRAYGPAMSTGRGIGFNEPTDKPWAHDLHELHENKMKPAQQETRPIPVVAETEKDQNKVKATSTAPNRSFSFTSILGNVNVQISLPGMAEKTKVPNVVKKHHVLLPQHRPPLRRDKPVRVSIPDAAPRYIFPSADRSFIFIPRALRPNQPGYTRGRGRGSFHGSRRPSIYGGGYTPSVAMSRKSSMGASTMREGIKSPTDSVISRPAATGNESSRPVVRMPSGAPTPSLSRTGLPIMNGHVPMNAAPTQMHAPAMYGSHSAAIPMHQPRPQKTVSVAHIESPAAFHFKAPQQQQEIPFHQQVPAQVSNFYLEDKTAAQPGQPTMSGMAGVAPLSQIPEGAVFAPGFQPYPVMGAAPYFGAPYSNGAVFYPPVPGTSSFGVPMAGPALAPSFVPGSQSHPINYLPATGPTESSTLAHESNGMVYYYNPTMFTPGAQSGMQQFPMAPNGNMMPLGNGMPSQAPYYYSSAPTGMFYPAQSG
ncbi:uncharacterized protein Z520_00998 [Fonsecaea multimorphosa CBS 102226]|uniref:Btz domain-containing protein n=1 Tax=Fonsecaea multimorphosa CBS 102226 TaxID=1442371 RepID=A0A0D2K8Y2_9EURO|nr:uncharacterized protein Z520_00998 [Fonsecaea multimorphosa CBS 102226]KIY02533.1 hypothetical protein Z520_00998 [Fonsecaea multimorphosa CBS 102226]OAL31400.1 hypothetical protein AYO22_00992 [Fonsecaea multimorphosa]